jgi:nucleotide-binding universal stress UspA family protein
MSPIRRILYPTDLSGVSLEALVMARTLAQRFGAEIDLLHVVPSLEIAYPLAPVYVPVPFDVAEYEQSLCTAAREQMTGVAARYGLPTERVHAIVGVGAPADEIVDTAEREKDDLIVMATHGHTGWRHLVFGSVAEKVMRLARCPVLLCPSGQSNAATADAGPATTNTVTPREWPLRKIVCSTDFSQESLKGVDTAIAWATQLGAELIIVHAVPSIDRYPSLVIAVDDIEASMEADAAKELYGIVAHRAPEALQRRYIVRSGNAAHEIVDVAREEGAELIVTATHGRTGWRHLAFGSVAVAVIRMSPCPVLTIRSAPPEARA